MEAGYHVVCCAKW